MGHGTVEKYIDGCRCDLCEDASNANPLDTPGRQFANGGVHARLTEQGLEVVLPDGTALFLAPIEEDA